MREQVDLEEWIARVVEREHVQVTLADPTLAHDRVGEVLRRDGQPGLEALQQHTETLLRELALVSVEAAEEWAPIALGVDFDELDHQLAAAMRAGEATTDLLLHVLPDSEPTVRKADDALRHGDRLASEGWLLCPPALPEVADCRRWFFEQLLGQLHGESAEPWRPRPHSSAEETPAVDHAAIPDHLAHAVVVADDENRIAYLDAAGEALLGWAADELVGQRLTTIVPHRATAGAPDPRAVGAGRQ